MKTKTIPFNLETAKKIQAGEIEGKIRNKRGNLVRLICTDLKSERHSIVGAFAFDSDLEECVYYYTITGICTVGSENGQWDLVLEVPGNEPQFKPFDRVLVRRDENDDGEPDTWVISFFMDESIAGYRVLNGEWFDQCIPYEGNQHLLGTTDKPKEDRI